MKISVFLTVLFLVSAATATEVRNPKELVELIQRAQVVSVEGRIPEEWMTFVSIPVRLESSAHAQEVAAFLKKQMFKGDPESTKVLREGGTFGSYIYYRIVIDDQYAVNVLGSDMFIFANKVAFVVSSPDESEETDFGQQFFQILGRLQKVN